MHTEVAVLTRVAEIENLPVPRILAYDPTHSLISSDYFFMEHISGTPLNKIKSTLTPEELRAIEKELGEYSRMINNCRSKEFGSFGLEEKRKKTWREAFQAMIEDVLTDGEEAGVDLSIPYSVIRSEMARNMSALDEVTEACLVHWDLWDGNVFVHDGRITGIIDFERAFWGDPLIEFYFGRFAGSTAFLSGYGKGEWTDSERTRRVLYDFYLDLVIVIERAYRQYENREHIKWAYDNFEEGYLKLQLLK